MHSNWRKISRWKLFRNEKPFEKCAKCIQYYKCIIIIYWKWSSNQQTNAEEMKWNEKKRNDQGKNVVAPSSFCCCCCPEEVNPNNNTRAKKKKQRTVEGYNISLLFTFVANAIPIHCLIHGCIAKSPERKKNRHTKAQEQPTKATATTTGNW